MKRGDAVCYRSISGQVYEAVATGDLREDGTVGVRVFLDFHKLRPGLELSRVPLFDGPTEQTMAAWPRRG